MSAPRGQMRTGDRVTGVFLSPSRVVEGDIWNGSSHVRAVPLVPLSKACRDAAFDHSCGSGYFVWGIAGLERQGCGARTVSVAASCAGFARGPGGRSWSSAAWAAGLDESDPPAYLRCAVAAFQGGLGPGPRGLARSPRTTAPRPVAPRAATGTPGACPGRRPSRTASVPRSRRSRRRPAWWEVRGASHFPHFSRSRRNFQADDERKVVEIRPGTA